MEVGRDTDGDNTDTHTYIHMGECSLSLPSSFLIFLSFLSPSWSQPALPPNSCTDRPSRIAAPQRPSVTFSAFGSISPVIIGCPFHCASTTMAAVSLPASSAEVHQEGTFSSRPDGMHGFSRSLSGLVYARHYYALYAYEAYAYA